MQPELAKRPHPPAELTAFGRHAVIVVNPSRTLERRTGVVLVPMADGRALISFDEPKTVAELELRIQDLLDDGQLTATDQANLGDLEHPPRSAPGPTGWSSTAATSSCSKRGGRGRERPQPGTSKHLEQKSLEQESLQEDPIVKQWKTRLSGGGRCPVSHRRLWRELRAERAGPGCRQRRRTGPRRPGGTRSSSTP